MCIQTPSPNKETQSYKSENDGISSKTGVGTRESAGLRGGMVDTFLQAALPLASTWKKDPTMYTTSLASVKALSSPNINTADVRKTHTTSPMHSGYPHPL